MTGKFSVRSVRIFLKYSLEHPGMFCSRNSPIDGAATVTGNSGTRWLQCSTYRRSFFMTATLVKTLIDSAPTARG